MPTPVQLGGTAEVGDGEGHALDEHSIARARRTMNEAEEWRRLNPDRYAWIEGRLLDAAHHGRKMSVRECAERIRWHDFTDIEGRPVRLSNTITGALARMLVRDHPEARGSLILRRSTLDLLER